MVEVGMAVQKKYTNKVSRLGIIRYILHPYCFSSPYFNHQIYSIYACNKKKKKKKKSLVCANYLPRHINPVSDCMFSIGSSSQKIHLVPAYTYTHKDQYFITQVHRTVFSPAHLRHVGPTSLQYRLSFDVGMGRIQRLWCGYRLHPNHALPSCLEICLGRTLNKAEGWTIIHFPHMF